MLLSNEARLAFNAYLDRMGELNGLPVQNYGSFGYSVSPVVQQKLLLLAAASSEFLSKVGTIVVKQQEGQKVGLNTTRTLAGRTDTSGGTRRNPTDPTDSADLGTYRCEQTNWDWALRYAKLDAWAHRPEFQQLLSQAIARQKALDTIMVGFNGTSVAATTNRTTNPLGQDVNKGWLHQIRTNAASRNLKQGTVAANKIYVSDTGTTGTNRDYVNLDALVTDAIELMDEWHRDSTDLVVIVGRDLVQDKYFNLINAAANTATEVEARDRILASSKTIGGLPAARVPFFPAKSMLITSYDNIPTYEQEGTVRRLFKDEPELDRVAVYDSNNVAYVVEDYGKTTLIDNIEMGVKP